MKKGEWLSADLQEELGAIGARPGIGHGQDTCKMKYAARVMREIRC